MTGSEFENEVRNIARALWSSEPGAGASLLVDGRERDCIFEQEHLTHYVEVTMLRTMEKVRNDVEKMTKLRDKQVKAGHLMKLWIVTLEEPTADQRTYCRANGVEILSLTEFRRRIIDANQYLEIRQNHPFGSASDPQSNSSDLSKVKYQPIAIHNDSSGQSTAITDVADMLLNRQQVLLLGDYGMGKSLNIRQLFLELRKRYFNSKGLSQIPVVLNLREHWGQTDPMEALRRHADLVGFDQAGQLVRAFNAGRLTILIDGFDEVGSTPWTKLPTKQLRSLRKNAVQLVAKFVHQTRGKSGLLIAGREHFFDSRDELRDAFELRGNVITLTLDEFTDEEASAFLKLQGLSDDLPDWFPKRPLLLANLAARGIIHDVLAASVEVEPAVAWDHLVDQICQRESAIHLFLDARGIRRILENLANVARRAPLNVGPITEDQLAEAFRAEVGAYPDESARPLLQRLPGLSLRNQQDGSRNFLDDHMLNILRAGRVREYAFDPWSDPNAVGWKHGLCSLGAQLVSERLATVDKSQVQVVLGAKEAISRWKAPTLALDLVLISQMLATDKGDGDFSGLIIEDGSCDVLDLANYPSPVNLRLKSCFISELILPNEQTANLSLDNCLIEKVVGVSEQSSLPDWISEAEVYNFDEESTNAKIMEERRLPVPVRVLLVILRKLYKQRGSGRRENALFRGLDAAAQTYVEEVLQILVRDKLTFSVKRGSYNIWYSVSGKRRRVTDILNSAGQGTDPVIRLVRDLSV